MNNISSNTISLTGPSLKPTTNAKLPTGKMNGSHLKGDFDDKGNAKYGELNFSSGISLEGKFKELNLVKGTKIKIRKGVIKHIIDGEFDGNECLKKGFYLSKKRFCAGTFKGTVKKNTLRRGIYQTRDGTTYQGKFSHRIMEVGEVRFPDGSSEIGFFEGKNLSDGVVFRKNGIVQIGKFKKTLSEVNNLLKESNFLEEGITCYPDEVVEQGLFDHNGRLKEGVREEPTGVICEGIFERRLIRGAIYLKDGKDFVHKVSEDLTIRGRYEGTIFKITTVVRKNVIYAGDFDDRMNFKSGTVTYPNNMVLSGTFRGKALENGFACLPIPEYKTDDGAIGVLYIQVENSEPKTYKFTVQSILE